MSGTPFTIDRAAGAELAVVTVDGVTQGPDADQLAAALRTLVDDGCTQLVVDLSDCPLLNSKVLDALVRVSGELDPSCGGGLAVVTDTSYVRHMLEISATGGVLLLAGSREEALGAFAAA